MGTINYKSNEYITIGINPDNFDYDDITFIYDEIKNILQKYNFNYFNVSIQPGYYEGFYIDIVNDYLYYDNWNEKRDVLKECTQLKLFLSECIENGLVKVTPGWCTGYYEYKNSKTELKKAIKQLKLYILKYPTYKTYYKGV